MLARKKHLFLAGKLTNIHNWEAGTREFAWIIIIKGSKKILISFLSIHKSIDWLVDAALEGLEKGEHSEKTMEEVKS